MLEYDCIDNSEGIDSTRNKLFSKECWLCCYWYFIDKNFNFHDCLCDGCYDMNIKAISINNLAIIYVGDKVYRINFGFMSKDDAINLIKNAVIIDKRGVL